MTVFEINEEKQGSFFDMEGGGRVQLRSMTADGLKAIRKQTVKKEVEYKRIEGKAERFEVEKVNDDLQNELFWDYIITGWENLIDGKGVAIPCTKENKILLMTRSSKFARFIGESLQKLNEDEAGQTEATVKN